MGAKFRVIEFMDSLIPSMDRTMGKESSESLRKLDHFSLKHKVVGVERMVKRLPVKARRTQKGEIIESKAITS